MSILVKNPLKKRNRTFHVVRVCLRHFVNDCRLETVSLQIKVLADADFIYSLQSIKLLTGY